MKFQTRSVFLFYLLIFSCSDTDGLLVDDLNIKKILVKKEFKYNISKPIKDFDSNKINNNLSKEYRVNIEFLDSIELDNFKTFLVKKTVNDTVFQSTGVSEFNVVIDEYGIYDLHLLPIKTEQINNLQYTYADTIQIKEFIILDYYEKWNDFSNENNGNWISNESSGLFSEDLISSLKSTVFKKTLENFNSCIELKLDLEFYIDQNNRISGQTLISRPYFDLVVDGIKKVSINSGFDNKTEKASFLVTNLKDETEIKFIRHQSLINSSWRIIPASNNISISQDSIFKIAYDTLNLIGYPLIEKIDSTSSTNTSISIDSLTESTPDFFSERLYYKILNENSTQSFVYGNKNGQIELNGDSILFDGIQGLNKLTMNLQNNRPQKIEFIPYQNLQSNNIRFNLYIIALKISCN
ncbi:hypothetical protein N9C47_03910 [Flavobacteriaceae bacterium]|nr:hypothetical protein [Flavobacteriaceae bacterium]